MYRIKAKICRRCSIIGYVLKKDTQHFPFHKNTVLQLAKQGEVFGVKVSGDRLKSTLDEADLRKAESGSEVIKLYADPYYSYKTKKHSYKEVYWGRIFHDACAFFEPTLMVIGTYRASGDNLFGYKVFCPETLDEYSVYLYETHQIISDKYRVTDGFGRIILRDNNDYTLSIDGDPEGIDKLPREYMGKCKPPTGGHLERDNLHEIWEFSGVFTTAMEEVICDLFKQEISEIEGEHHD
jgi:hypothetical protein